MILNVKRHPSWFMIQNRLSLVWKHIRNEFKCKKEAYKFLCVAWFMIQNRTSEYDLSQYGMKAHKE